MYRSCSETYWNVAAKCGKGIPERENGDEGWYTTKKIIKLSGKGKLTEIVINSMQNFYGLAIRGNIGNFVQ